MKAGTQERRTERVTERVTEVRCKEHRKYDAKYAKMNVHAHIVKEHMVIGATVKSTR